MEKTITKDDVQNWWNNQNEDEQIWLMMKYGFEAPFDPERLSFDEKREMYILEK